MPNDHLLQDELAMRERCERATAGPWRVDGTKALGAYAVYQEDTDYLESLEFVCKVTNAVEIPTDSTRAKRDANAAFIAHARTDLPDLLTRLAAERAEVERLRAELEKRT